MKTFIEALKQEHKRLNRFVEDSITGKQTADVEAYWRGCTDEIMIILEIAESFQEEKTSC